MLKEYIDNRTVNSLGISVGTALALESLFDIPKFDPERPIPNKVDPTVYKNHVYNVLTLFRNVINSIQYKEKDVLLADKDVQEQVLNDIYNIQQLYISSTNIKPIFYLPTYDEYNKKFNAYKGDGVYKPFINYAFLRKCAGNLKIPEDMLYKSKNGKLGKLVDKTLLLTHYTVDLLNIDHIPQLTLLESHTGKIKTKSEWGTKYHPIGKRDLSILPFHRKILVLLGDKTIVKPESITRRRELYDLAIKNKWHPNMSVVKLERDLMDIII